MTIRLLEGIQLAGIHQAVGSILTLTADAEARHVASNKAVYTTLPNIGDDGVPVLATKNVTGGIELSAGGEPIELGGTPDQIGFLAPLKIGFAGDSIGGLWNANDGLSPLWWAATELYPCEYEKVFNSSVGGTSSSHLISTQLPQLQAAVTKPDIMVVATLQNDYIGSAANADFYAAYVTQYAAAVLAAGVKVVCICAHPPKSSVPDVAAGVLRLNKILDNFCRVTKGCVFFDVVGVWRANPTAAESGINWRGTANTADAYSNDGTHPIGMASRAAAPLIEPILRRWARPIFPMPMVAQNYDDVNWPFNNVLGLEGLMIGTNGHYNAAPNANVAGSVAGTYTRWQLTDGNGILATPSLVIGPDGYTYQELTLSGTASADATVTLKRQYIHNVASGNFIAEAIVYTESLIGVSNIAVSLSGFVGGFNSGTKSQFSLPSSRLHYRSPIGVLSNSGFVNKDNFISISVPNGATVSGKVRIGRVGLHRVG